MSELYRGYIIEVRTPGERKSWRALVNIEKHTDVVVDDVRVPATFVSPTDPIPQIFETETEAHEAGLVWGRNMVDDRLTPRPINA
jgi:hypothetical protein